MPMNTPKTNAGHTQRPDGGRPFSSSNAFLMHGGSPERYSANGGPDEHRPIHPGQPRTNVKLAESDFPPNLFDVSVLRVLRNGAAVAFALEKEAEAAPANEDGGPTPAAPVQGAPAQTPPPPPTPAAPGGVVAQFGVPKAQTQAEANDKAAQFFQQGQTKTADEAVLAPMRQYVLFTPDGRLIARRLDGRRFTLPTQGKGRPAPYEPRIQFLPPGGAAEEGVHGYDVELNIGESPDVPEGYEALDPEEVLRDLYASMGASANRPYRDIDRARARTIVRALKKRQAVQ